MVDPPAWGTLTRYIRQGLQRCELVPEAKGRTYWIADERPYTTNEIVDTVEALLRDEFGFEVSGKRMRLPDLVSGVAWLIDRQGNAGTFAGLETCGDANSPVAAL